MNGYPSAAGAANDRAVTKKKGNNKDYGSKTDKSVGR